MRQSDTSPTERVPSNPVRPVLGKQAEVLPPVKDRYKRTVARIKCSGVDANAEQVKCAWPGYIAAIRKITISITRKPRFAAWASCCMTSRSGELAQPLHSSLGFLQHRNNLLHSEPFLLHANLLYSQVSFAEN